MWTIPYLFAALLLVVSLPVGGEPETRPADHVVLISIDGLRPEFYLDPRWPAPMLRQLVARGAHAEGVQGVFPTVTYPSHTTIVTGVRPDRHGIHYNSPFEPDGQTGRWFWEESLIRVPALWDLTRKAGLQTAALGWPVTVGAPIDRNVPEVWSLDRDAVPLAATTQRTLVQLQEDWLRWLSASYRETGDSAAVVIDRLLATGDELDFQRFPDLSLGAMQQAARAAREGDIERATWILETAERLDPGQPETAFAEAYVSHPQGCVPPDNWMRGLRERLTSAVAPPRHLNSPELSKSDAK